MDLHINDLFFLVVPNKRKILNDLEFGFRADWTPNMPPIFDSPPNFFKNEIAVKKCRERFSDEVKLGRMVGGFGWNKNDVQAFLGRKFYTIPCGAVPKNGDPAGRIIHNYSFPLPNSKSINSALADTSVSYLSFKDRVARLSKVNWFIKADLKNGSNARKSR